MVDAIDSYRRVIDDEDHAAADRLPTHVRHTWVQLQQPSQPRLFWSTVERNQVSLPPFIWVRDSEEDSKL